MPYLLSLGLSKSGTSIVWIAGPLAGILTAPTIGAVADRSRSAWGRRRPFMIVGSVAVIACFWALGSAKEIVRFVRGGTDEANQGAVVGLAVASIWVVDFAINVGEFCPIWSASAGKGMTC